jgi:hypothetical protein
MIATFAHPHVLLCHHLSPIRGKHLVLSALAALMVTALMLALGVVTSAFASDKPTLSGSVALDDVLQGRVANEGIDWYGWYQGYRQYVAVEGGFDCPPGSSIEILPAGQMRVLDIDATRSCKRSVSKLQFPLPAQSAVERLIIRTRSFAANPATREEFQGFLNR